MCIVTCDAASNWKIQKTKLHVILAPKENVKFGIILFVL